MQRIPDAGELDHHRIASELMTLLGFEADEAERFVASGPFEDVTLMNALKRIRGLADAIGRGPAAKLLRENPAYAECHLERLGERMENLRRDGYTDAEAQRILSDLIDLSRISNKRFYETHNALCDLLTIRRHRHALVLHEPRVYLLPTASFKKLTGMTFHDAPSFWNEICERITDWEVLVSKGPPRKNAYLSDDAHPVFEFLVQRKVPIGTAKTLAIRMDNAFGNRAWDVLTDFLQRGWHPGQIRSLLDASFHGWREAPSVLFTAEDALADMGADADTVRDLLIERPELTTVPPERLRDTVRAFQQRGIDIRLIFKGLRNHWRIATVSAQQRDAWFTRLAGARLSPLGNLRSLYTGTDPPRLHIKRKKKMKVTKTIRPPRLVEEVTERPTLPSPGASPPREPPLQCPEPPRERPQRQTEEADGETSAPFHKPTHALSEEDLDALDRIVPKTWEPLIHDILCTEGASSWSEALWSSRRDQLSWIWQPASDAAKVIETFARWASFTPRKGEADNARPMLAAIIKDPKLHPIFKLKPQELQIRMGVLRKIVQKDFLTDPVTLLLPFDRLEPKEIQYRVNEVESRGKSATKRPYLNMLVLEDRETFQQQLAFYLKYHG